MNPKWFCRVMEDYDSFHLVIDVGYEANDKIYLFQDGEFKEIERWMQINKHSLRLPSSHSPESYEILTALVDGLLKHGAKPSQPIKNEPELEAVKYHLEDMRKLTFEEDK